MTLLSGFKVIQIGGGPAAAVCCRLLADVGAQVTCIDPGAGTMLLAHLNHGKAVAAEGTERRAGLAAAHLIVREGQPKDWLASPYDLTALRRINASAIVVTISPYGETGPQADDPATDLTLFFASGIARLLTGQVDDLSEAPIRPVGEQSAFIGGLAAACAGMHASLANQSGVRRCVDPGPGDARHDRTPRAGLGQELDRKRLGDGNGATVTILPARDGCAAISCAKETVDGVVEAMGSRLGRRPLCRQGRVKTGMPACADVAWSRQRQAMDRRYRAARHARLPLRDVSGISTRHRCGTAATRRMNLPAKPFRCRARRCPTVVASGRKQRTPDGAAAVRQMRARFQRDRRSDDDALPGRDGGGSHQGRSARQGRPGARIGTAYGAWAGEEEHRA
jgi:crotonobetainyl-CoA:carnitine CoA-transferase CaiB-like acyl-CoA transferase